MATEQRIPQIHFTSLGADGHAGPRRLPQLLSWDLPNPAPEMQACGPAASHD